MDRSIIQNEMTLPEIPANVQKMRKVSIGSLAILERLGNPLVATIIGVGDAKFTDSIEDLLELFYVHSVDDEGYYDIVNNIDNPEEIKRQSIMWGSNMNISDIAKNLAELMKQSELVQGSMVESVKTNAKGRKNE